MVATVIMVIMVGLVIWITSQVLNVWNKSTGKLAANAEARIAMDFLTSDLEAAVFRNNGQQWMRVEGGAGGNLLASNPPPYASQTVALKFFSSVTDSNPGIAGDICGVSYRLAYQGSYNGAAAPDVYALYRAIEEPDITFNTLLAAGNLTLPTTSIWNGATVTNPDNFLAANVVDFQVFLYSINPTDDRELALNPVQGDDGNPVQGDDGNPVQGAGGNMFDYVYGGDVSGLVLAPGVNDVPILPSYADIILRVISEEAMALLSSGNFAQSGFATADAYIAANSQVFTRRVYFTGP